MARSPFGEHHVGVGGARTRRHHKAAPRAMQATTEVPLNLETRRAAVALLLLVPVPSLGVLAGMFLLPGRPAGAILFFAAKLWVFLLPAAWRRLVDRRPPSLSPMRRGGLRAGLSRAW